MSCRVLLIVGLFTGLVAVDLMAQGAPSVMLKVRKSPGGQGQVVSYDLEQKTLVVSLRMPSGHATQVEVSRHYVSPRAWQFLSEIARATKAAKDKSLIDEPIEIEGQFGDKGTIVAFDADTNAVLVDFGGKQGREIPISQLKPRSWAAAKVKIGRSIPPTEKPKATESNEKEST
jgi:hypothetical protein